MNFPKGFRYKSDWDTFCTVVESAEILIQSKALFLLFGFEEDISFQELYSEKDFDTIGFPIDKQVFDKILYDEILYLINILIKVKTMDSDADRGINAYLKREDVGPEDCTEIRAFYQKKLQYVESHLFPCYGTRRSDFKLFTTSQKIQELDWDICKYVFSDGTEQPYVQFKLSLLEDLPEIQSMSDVKPECLQFVCDAQDISYIVERLKQIQRRLEEL